MDELLEVSSVAAYFLPFVVVDDVVLVDAVEGKFFVVELL